MRDALVPAKKRLALDSVYNSEAASEKGGVGSAREDAVAHVVQEVDSHESTLNSLSTPQKM